MAIVGGALIPFAQGFVADSAGVQPSIIVPMLCYSFNLFIGLRYARVCLGDATRA